MSQQYNIFGDQLNNQPGRYPPNINGRPGNDFPFPNLGEQQQQPLPNSTFPQYYPNYFVRMPTPPMRLPVFNLDLNPNAQMNERARANGLNGLYNDVYTSINQVCKVKKMELWDVKDVEKFVVKTNAKKFVSQFTKHAIDGKALKLLRIHHMTTIMHIPLGVALKFMDDLRVANKTEMRNNPFVLEDIRYF